MGVFVRHQKLSWHWWGISYSDKEKKNPLGKTLFCNTPEYNRVSVNIKDFEIAEQDSYSYVLFKGNGVGRLKLVSMSEAIELYKNYGDQISPEANYKMISWDVILGQREDIYFPTDESEQIPPTSSNMKEIEFIRNDNVDWALGIELNYPLGNSKMKTLIHAMEEAGVARITIDIERGVFIVDKNSL